MEQVAPIGRRDLLAGLNKALSTPATRVALVGEPGIGKTTVLRWVMSEFTATCRLVAVTASEPERLVGLAAITDVVRPLADTVTRLPPHVQRQLAFLTDPLGEVTARWDLRLAGLALSRLLAETALDRPLLIAIDDFQWVDDASYTLLSYALRRMEGADVRVVVAGRPAEDRVLPDATTMEVGPVDVGALRGLVASQLSRALPLDVAAALHESVGGNPMYAMEIVRSLPPHASVADVQLPARLTDLVVSRISKLPADCRSSLLDVAVRGRAALHELASPQSLDPAFEARIVHRRGSVVEFTHPLLRRGVIDAAGPGELQRAHLAAAADSTDPISRALHIAAAEPRDDEQAAADLESASVTAFRIGDAPSARLLAAAAIDATPRDSLRWGRVASLARAVAVSGPFPPALAEQMLALATNPDDVAATWLTIVEGGRTASEEWQALARRAMDLEGTSPGTVLRAASTLAAAMMFAGRPCSELLARLEEAIARAQALWDIEERGVDNLTESEARGLAACLAARTLFTTCSGRLSGDEDLELARRLEGGPAERTAFEDATSVRGMRAMWDDRHAEARECLDPARKRELGLGFGDAVHLAELECRLGNFDAVPSILRPQMSPDWDPFHYYVLGLGAAWQGDEARCREATRWGRELAEELEDAMFRLGMDIADALLDLGMGRLQEAREASIRAADVLQSRDWNEPSMFPVLPIAIEASALTGSLDEAGRLLRRLEEHAESLNSRWARAGAMRGRGLLLGASGDARGGLALAVSSVEAFDGLDLPAESARSALAAGRLARRAGERTLAREWLERAVELLEPRGCVGFLAQARDEMSRLGGRQVNDSTLTEAEYRVAELAAEGLTNPEIAAAAYLSVKTVEAHLSRVYRKLGVRSRSELAARWEN